MNRIGDFGFICGVFFLFYLVRTVDFSTLFVLAPFFSEIKIFIYPFSFSFLDVICFFLFIGSMGKSAQIGLHT